MQLRVGLEFEFELDFELDFELQFKLNLNHIFAKCKVETRPKTICIKLPIVRSFCVQEYKNYIFY